MENTFLPVSRKDMEERGQTQLDFVFISGDAYVDHPSFGPAILCRLLEAHGYSTGIIAQPDYRDPESVCIFGEPRLAFLPFHRAVKWENAPTALSSSTEI